MYHHDGHGDTSLKVWIQAFGRLHWDQHCSDPDSLQQGYVRSVFWASPTCEAGGCCQDIPYAHLPRQIRILPFLVAWSLSSRTGTTAFFEKKSRYLAIYDGTASASSLNHPLLLESHTFLTGRTLRFSHCCWQLCWQKDAKTMEYSKIYSKMWRAGPRCSNGSAGPKIIAMLAVTVTSACS